MGLESCVADELVGLGFLEKDIHKLNGQVILDLEQDISSISRAVALCNVHLRTAERVELQLCQFPAKDFDDLFEQAQEYPWEEWIEENAAILVKGFSRKSELFAPSAIQSTLKKAIILRLQSAWKMSPDAMIPENRDFKEHRIHYNIMDNQVTLSMDTSGTGLHKRSYRLAHNEAPIKETLAAGILQLSRFEAFSGELLYDPCCGSGTFLIEAAMIAANIAPGARRSFSAENWNFLETDAFARAKEKAIANETNEDMDETFIAGSDINPISISMARENASRAGVLDWINFSCKDLKSLNAENLMEEFEQDKLLIIANPPYGERMSEEEEVRALNQAIGKIAFYPNSTYTNPNCRLTVISSTNVEADTAHRADKRRKLYNGMIKCTMFHYFREKRL